MGKKIISIILVLCFCVAVSVTAFAATPSITVSEVAAKRGEEVTVAISLDGNPGIVSMKLVVAYDVNALEYKGVTVNSEFHEAASPKPTPTESNGKITINWMRLGGDNFSANGTFAEITFAVRKTATDGANAVTVTYDPEDVYDVDVVNVTFDVINGAVNVAPCEHTNTESRNAKTATCTEKGYTGDTYCNDCERIVVPGTETDKDSNNHGTYGTEIRNAVTANCHTDGYTGDTCCVGCGAVKNAGTKEGKDANSHDGGTEVRDAVKATCSAEGFSGNTYCKGCNAKIADGSKIAVDPNAHEFESPAVTKEPTCTEKGEQKGTCKLCSQETTQEVPALGHSWGNWVTVKEATYSEKGLKKRTCARCNATEQEEIAMLHKVADTTVVEIGGPKDNTSTNEGEENPNTGASVACIAGIAVIAVAVAAVGIKKK